MSYMSKDVSYVSDEGTAVWKRWSVVALRSLAVGAGTGIVGGALIFFVFGFIGYAGASFSRRLANGWDAAIEPGLSKGLAAGVAIALGLCLTILLVFLIGHRLDAPTARPWLAVLAGVLVVVDNAESLRNALGWDAAGLATVVAISLLVGGTVWLVTPWVLRDRPEE